MNAAAAGLAIIDMLLQVAVIAGRFREMKRTAEAEGRDITDDELDELRAKSRAVVKGWDSA